MLPTSRKVALIGVSFLFLSACSASPDCSSDKVVATIKKIAMQRMPRNDPQMNLFVDLDKTVFEVTAIRTVSADSKSCSCKASLSLELQANDRMRKLKETNPEEFNYLVPSGSLKLPKQEMDITYQAELTDDKKDIYVTIQGLRL